MTELTSDDATLLNRAAGLLDNIGRNAERDDNLAALHCLHAAELLTRAGATVAAVNTLIRQGEAATAIREALRLLSNLSDPTFDSALVTQAVDATQRAYAAVTP